MLRALAPIRLAMALIVERALEKHYAVAGVPWSREIQVQVIGEEPYPHLIPMLAWRGSLKQLEGRAGLDPMELLQVRERIEAAEKRRSPQ